MIERSALEMCGSNLFLDFMARKKKYDIFQDKEKSFVFLLMVFSRRWFSPSQLLGCFSLLHFLIIFVQEKMFITRREKILI